MTYPRRLFILFAATGVVLVGSLLVLFFIGVMSLFQNQAVQRHEINIGRLQQLLAAVSDAESARRAFIITNDRRFAQACENAAGRVNNAMADLHKNTARDAFSPVGREKLDNSVADKMEELQNGIDQRRKELAQKLPLTAPIGPGAIKLDALRAQIKQMVDHQRDQVVAAQDAATQLMTARARIFLAILLLNLLVLISCYRRIKKEAIARQSAALDVQQQKDLLAVTLGSIGDAVMVADPQSRVTYMNAVAEALTGWTLDEAKGKPCGDVFHIINEETRQPVQSPVQMVLHQGVIVGLANHTILVRKDGREIPIDDSGAPIRDADGTVRGVVLIFRDFSERKEAERKLLAAKQEVEASSKAKDQFLASLSHELRTPLTPVLATLTAWDIKNDVPTNLRDDVEMLRRNVELEARLIDDLLDITRIAKGKMSLNRERSDVHALTQAAAGVCEAEIAEKQIRVSMVLDAQSHYAQVDPARLQQVFWNVLKNATKFTPQHGTITVQSRNIGDQIQVSITDTGIGMSQGTMDRLFLPFEQGAGDITRRFGGLGLGMTISKAIIDEHAGTISAHSDGDGTGSCFTITLPTVAAPAASTFNAVGVRATAQDQRPATQDSSG